MGAKCPRDGYYYIYEDALKDAHNDAWLGKLAADKYVVLSLISEGGMGAVYRAMQLPIQREVAFKVLLSALQDSSKGHDRFAREARAISKLTHPNIITMHDFGVDDAGHPFMVMEYAPGKSLAEWMVQPGIKLDRITHVFSQILSALSEAHSQGVVHRDLKPENLIVTRSGNDPDFIKLLDFGIARMVHDGATRGLTREGEVFGTPHYMAPEQAQGHQDIGPPADVYALGIMLYELLSGECPFDAPTPLSILYMHINDDLPELSGRNGVDIPPAFRQIIDKATAKEPEDRYADAGEMLDAFEAAIGVARPAANSPAATGRAETGEHIPEAKRLEKATAETLMFGSSVVEDDDDDERQEPALERDTRRDVARSQSPGASKTNTDLDFEDFGAGRRKKMLIAAVGLVLLCIVGGGVVLGLMSDEPPPPNAAADEETTAEATDDSAGVAAREDQGDKTDEGTADNTQGGDEAAKEAVGEADPDEDNAPATGSSDSPSPSRAAADKKPPREDRAPARVDKKSGESASSGSTDQQTDSVDVPSPGDQSASKDRGDSAPTDSQQAASEQDESQQEGGPRKFEPKNRAPRKFERKSDPDDTDESKPRKWR